jgi:tRNA modification GTPase
MSNKQRKTTIAAIATARGLGGIGIIRVSGPQSVFIGQVITSTTKSFPDREAIYTKFLAQDGSIIDIGIALYFPGPHSFTGEDVLELHGHGGPVVLDCLLQRVLGLGAVLARPGEFSERAFLHNKIDLTQAEAIASLIEARTEAEAKASIRSLQGSFSKIVYSIADTLINLRQYIEASIDFPEDELDLLEEAKVGTTINTLREELEKLLLQTKQGVLLSDGVKTAIVGQVNAGKSSLLNLLTGTDTAIVTEIPGTTRDLVKEIVLLDGIKLELIDTAGLRETSDVVEREGVQRAFSVIEQAELILLIIDGYKHKDFSIFDISTMFPEVWQKVNSEAKLIVVYNKIDLLGKAAVVGIQEKIPVVKLSSKTGEGKELLLQEIKHQLNWAGTENVFIARRRHLEAIQQALIHIKSSALSWQHYGNGEVLAEDLRLAQLSLGEVTGEFGSDDLLDKIFSEFCIGK